MNFYSTHFAIIASVRYGEYLNDLMHSLNLGSLAQHPLLNPAPAPAAHGYSGAGNGYSGAANGYSGAANGYHPGPSNGYHPGPSNGYHPGPSNGYDPYGPMGGQPGTSGIGKARPITPPRNRKGSSSSSSSSDSDSSDSDSDDGKKSKKNKKKNKNKKRGNTGLRGTFGEFETPPAAQPPVNPVDRILD